MLEVQSLTRCYGSTLANDRITLAIKPGKITGLLGENGAGKTTLLSILSGFDRPDEGSVVLNGQPLSFTGPGDALANGIALVHQHLSLVPTFTVREQLRLAGWDGHGNPVPSLNLDRRIEHLTLAQRQQVEVGKALLTNPRVLLLDEPTSILAPDQIDALFAQLRSLAEDGTSIVLVSHKLREILAIADEIVVLQRGRVIDQVERENESWTPGIEQRLLKAMFGQTSPISSTTLPEVFPNSALKVVGQGLNLNLSRRTLLVIVGIDGQGQANLMDCLIGRNTDGTTIAYEGRPASTDFFDGRVGRVSEDRLGTGSISSMTLAENLMLGRQDEPGLRRFGFVDRFARNRLATQSIAEWGIQPANPNATMATLSGGNIQRAILSRELDRNPAWLVANNPNHGLDARTADRVWTRLQAYCASGGIVIAFLSDLDEALTVASHIAVCHAGQISSPEPVAQISPAQIQSMMVSGW